MGKSSVASLFRQAKVPVFDADRVVHQLQGRGGAAVEAIAALVPGAVSEGAVDRGALRRAVNSDPSLLSALERIIHPLVRARQSRFLRAARRRRAGLVVLDIPLLFEGGGDRACDLVVTVSAPAATQRHRIRARRRMSDAEAAQIVARQMSDAERCRRADLVIRTGLSRHHAARQVRLLLARLRKLEERSIKLH